MAKQINGLAANEGFGRNVSLSSDGTTVAIGAPNANSNTGATRIYKWNNSSWAMLGSQITGSAANEFSGTSVSLSSDGTIVAIGEPYANSYKGVTRIYKWNSSSWDIMDKQIDGFFVNEESGTSVSLSSDGTVVAIGAPYALSATGTTRIYKWNNSSWAIMDKQIDGSVAQEFSGTSVSLSSDGTIVAIGAIYTNSNAGATRIYKWNNSSWAIMDKRITGLAANEQSGYSVSLSSDGITVAIGAPNANSYTGATRIYKWNSSSWIMLGSQINGVADEYSGSSVSLSSDGTTVAIGAPYNSAGTTRIYKWNNSSWDMGSQINGLAANERSGTSVSLSSNGTTVAIGAPAANSNTTGITRIYKNQ